MHYFEKAEIEAKNKIKPTLFEIKKKIQQGKSMEGVIKDTLDVNDFDYFTSLGLSLSYLLCISKALLDGKEKPLDRALKDNYIVENSSDISSIMISIVELSIQFAEKNLIQVLGLEDTKKNKAIVKDILLGMYDTEDKEEINSLRESLMEAIKTR